MSRLVDLLLNEDMTQQNTNTVIDGRQYKKYSDIGNLYRLMLITVPDNFFTPTTIKTSIVSTMLKNLVDDQTRIGKKTIASRVSSIQRKFNIINKLVQDVDVDLSKFKKKGENVRTTKKRIKLEYFIDLFELFKHFLHGKPSANKPVMSYAKIFANEGKKNLSNVRIIAMAIGKDIKMLPGITQKDKGLIDVYVKALAELEGLTVDGEPVENPMASQMTNSPETEEELSEPPAPEKTQEKQPVNSVTKVVNSEKTTEDLEKIKDQTTEVIDSVRQLQKDNSNEISTLLKTNEMSSIFNVQMTDRDVPVQPIINKSIEETYNRVKAEFGKETANFVGKYVSDHFKQLNTLNGYLNFLNSNSVLEPKISVEKLNNGFRVEMDVASQSLSNEHKFFVGSTFTDDDAGNMNVYWDKIQIPQSAQSSGISKKIFKDNLDLYKAQGVNKISLEANVDVGGYAWFRFGFLPKDTTQIEDIAQWMRDVAGVVSLSISTSRPKDAIHLSEFILEKTHTVTTGVENLASLIKNRDSKVESVITELFNKCATEFQETFDSKEKFKELGKNIAIMNFKEYNIGGKPYSISYKAMLSIQAANDSDGDRMIPMNSKFGDVYLSWQGELDMNDLEDTYAYLNL